LPFFARFLTYADDRAARLEVVPQDLEYRPGHVGMAHDVVGAPDELLAAVAGDADEDAVPARDDALAIRRREEQLVGVEGLLGRSGDGRPGFHG
jgi:hypothetical protein